MGWKKARIFGLEVDTIGLNAAADACMKLIGAEGGYVVTLNPEMCMASLKDRVFADIIRGASLVVPDGIGITWALGRLGYGRTEKVPGIELAEAVVARCAASGVPIYLLGAKPGVAERAAASLALKHSGLKVAGVKDGYFPAEQEETVAAQVMGQGAGLVLVALGAGRQEAFMARACSMKKGVVMIGVGGSLDVFSGDVQRAPLAVRKAGMEWLYRGLSQPSRARRLMKLPEFAFTVLFRRSLAKNGRKL
ncbi:MAG TPA: WecB/TagA/CpsF family glycosyltransferase [Bacillota bacterium]|nr:WecB/TagA/CpsF family glycosyltransferase [Bacillota bacterium]